jgi:uncharacterized membrane protein YdjX (TVP38/TMEM64 family)
MANKNNNLTHQVEEKKIIPNNKINGLISGLVILIIFSLLWVSRSQLLDVLDFFRDREAVTAYLEPLGFWGPLLYLLVVHVQVLTATVPGHGLMLTAGYLYGFADGFTLNLIGGVGASQLAFVIARRAGQPAVSRWAPPHLLQRWQRVAEQQGFFFFLICFWLPIVPHNITNYIAGLSSISFGQFFWANLLGRLPGLIIITLIGSYGLEFSWQQWSIIGAGGLLLIVGGRYLAQKFEHRWR